MELPGSTYLYTLATLAMTFAGFCAIVIGLRQTIGKPVSGFHIVLTRLYLESGLLAAAFAVLPPLLAVCGLGETIVWRTASATIAMVMVGYGATYAMRRSAIVAGRVPRRRWIPIVAISSLVIMTLIGNVVGFPYRPSVGPVAVAASWTLGCGAIVFVLALNALWGDAAEARTAREV